MFKKTYIAPFTKPTASFSNDVLYWKNFTVPILLKEVNSVDYIDVSHNQPHFIAVTCSSRVQLYHPITRMIHKNYNRFKESAYGAVFRKDGRLLLAGSEESSLKLFDVSSKNLLRVFKGHSRPVHRCAFLPTENQIASFSDDKSVIHWDIPNETIIHRYEGHTDYVRSGITLESNPNLILSGSYDHTVKIWDKRQQKETISVDHGSPVESILISPNGSLLFTAGSTEIKVWDCLTNGRLLSKISQHHKTITCLRFATDNKRLVSASLDRHIKIYDMLNFEVIHTYDYSSPIVSLAIAPNDSTLICGMTDGIVAISRKEEESSEKQEEIEAENIQIRRKKGKTFSDFVQTNFGIKEGGSTRDTRHDAYLRKFRYSKALDQVLSDYHILRNPAVTVAVIQELIRRDGLRTALAGRSEQSLIKVIKFLIRNLRKPRFMRILMEVSNILLELYANKAGEDPVVDKLLLDLYHEVSKEVDYMTELMEVQGSLEMLIAGNGSMTEQNNFIPSTSLKPTQNALENVIVDL